MNSCESTVEGDLILKTEEFDIDGPSALQSTLVFNPSNASTGNRNQDVNFTNNSLTVRSDKSRNSLSPEINSFCQLPPSSQLSPSNRMPIPSVPEMQSAAGATPCQHSISPSLPQKQPEQTITNGSTSTDHLLNSRRISSILGGYGLVPPGILGPLDHYRLQLYSYAMNVERLRGCGGPQQYAGLLYPPGHPGSAGGPVANGPYAPTRFALSMGLFPNRMFQPEEPKPQHSYIGLIAMAILSSAESKLVLSDIYQYILDNYPYFRSRGPGWRNSIRHNLSLNDCFIKAGRSANGKGHYWAVHPANLDDFRKGDFRRRKAQRKVRKHMGLAVDDEGTDSPSPPPLAVTPPPMAPPNHPGILLVGANPYASSRHPQHYSNSLSSVILAGSSVEASPTTATAGVIANLYSQTKKRQFDVASLLAPDDTTEHHHYSQQPPYKGHLPIISKQRITFPEEEDIDVVASDVDDEQEEHMLRVDDDPYRRPSNSNQNDVTNSLSFSPPPDFNNHHIYQNSSSPQSQTDHPSEIRATNNNNQNPTTTNWQGLIQHWPNDFNTAAAAAAAAAMDPRIFGHYYSQYMAAAAARRVVGVSPAAAAAAAAVIGQHQITATKQQSNPVQQQNSSLQQTKQQQQQLYEC